MLGTPPAFILSQDQTLILKSLPASFHWLFIPLFSKLPELTVFWVVTSIFDLVTRSWYDLFASLWITPESLSRACSLGIFQGCITVYLSRYCLLLFTAATLLSYHRSFALSTTFFIFSKLFLLCKCLSTLLSGFSFYHMPIFLSTTFFKFLTFFKQASQQELSPFRAKKKKSQSLKILSFIPIGSETEKEGFEPSRRVNDLHP